MSAHQIFYRYILACVAALGLSAGAFSQTVEFKLLQPEGWVGTPIKMQVVVANAKGQDLPPEITPSPDFQSLVAGSPQRMEMRQNINGVSSQKISTTWTLEMTPTRAGVLTLPKVKVVADGRVFESPPQNVSISVAATGDVLQVTVKSNPPVFYSGQSVDLILEIAIRPYSNREYDVFLNERQMWELIDKSSSSWGVFQPRMRELVQNNQRPSGREEVRNGAPWCVYEITTNTNATRSGALDIGDVRIDLRYPTGITVNRDFFGSPELSISGVRNISVSSATSNVVVKALPEIDKPSSFRGAVGQFSIQATVKPNKIAVGDPMTLTLSIQTLSDNTEALRTLLPPPLDGSLLTNNFRMPTDPLAGTVNGSTKIFTQTLRALSADTKEIPPIEFSYFDPSTSKYVTTSTKSIPISVSPAERLSTNALDGINSVKSETSKATLTQVDGGLFANAAPSADLARDQQLTVGWATGMILATPPLVAITLLVLRKRKEQAKNNAGVARAKGAAKIAHEQLVNAHNAATIAKCIQTFIESQTNRSIGTVTRSDALECAEEAGANLPLLQSLSTILALGERAAFAPQGLESAQTLRDQAAQLIRDLDQLSWRRRRASNLEDIKL